MKRLAGPEPLESRCLLSAAVDTAATPDTFYGGYLSVSGIYRRLDEIAATYPAITELRDYGDSYSKTVGGVVTPGGQTLAGYDLLAMRITNEAIAGPKPVFVLMAGIHAREIATPEIALRFADWLTQNYGQDADATWLVDQHEIWVLPTANPDGHWYVELGTQVPNGDEPWLWRKNGHAYEPGAWPPTAFDHYGVDLNRNFDFHWGTQGVEWDARSQTYPGPAAASEPETRALQELLSSVFADQRGPQDSDPASDTTSGIFVSLHQHGELVLWPWWDTDSAAPNATGLEAIGRKFASYNGYTAGPGASTLYHASGTADDWTYGTLGVPSFTFEMGLEFTPSYATVDETLWPENIGALVYAAKLARTPYATVLGPDVKLVTVGRVGAGSTVSATIDDTPTAVKRVAAAEYYVDIPPWHSGAVLHRAGGRRWQLRRPNGAGGRVPVGRRARRPARGLRPRPGALGHWGPLSAGLWRRRLAECGQSFRRGRHRRRPSLGRTDPDQLDQPARGQALARTRSGLRQPSAVLGRDGRQLDHARRRPPGHQSFERQERLCGRGWRERECFCAHWPAHHRGGGHADGDLGGRRSAAAPHGSAGELDQDHTAI